MCLELPHFAAVIGVEVAIIWMLSVLLAYLLYEGRRIYNHPANDVRRETLPSILRLPILEKRRAVRDVKIEPEKGIYVKAKSAAGREPADYLRYEWEVDMSEVTIGDFVGEGAFGEVYRGEWGGVQLAVKMLKTDVDRETKARFLKEVGIMSTLHHPNVVMFLGACITEPNICMLMEYLPRGNLKDFIYQTKDACAPYGPALAHKFLMDICRGMRYLHRRAKLTQRDLKPENLLVDTNCNVKVSDFGLSRFHMGRAGGTKSHGSRGSRGSGGFSRKESNEWAGGTPAWTAPEIVRKERTTPKSDVYSFSIIIYEMVFRRPPYEELNIGGIEIAHKVANGGLRPRVPKQKHLQTGYIKMMNDCWADDPLVRPSFSHVLNDLHQMYNADDELRDIAGGLRNAVNKNITVDRKKSFEALLARREELQPGENGLLTIEVQSQVPGGGATPSCRLSEGPSVSDFVRSVRCVIASSMSEKNPKGRLDNDKTISIDSSEAQNLIPM
mmetsp:Transcript_26275/g.81843  ORF Transcript_26275/g.81843 Transcript_26275/m.81843 type:complete len:499 (-) Transcript_26275:129-1625(-)